MRTLVVTDLHFVDKPIGMLGAQVKCIKKLVEDEKPSDVIIMGDLMMHRKPSPSVLLGLKEVVDFITIEKKLPLVILRGNHDSETKADDGVTSLSLFGNQARVVTHFDVDHERKRVYIPHYESEDRITQCLKDAPSGYRVFGHFGYRGCLNSFGDPDSNLCIDSFYNDTLLGHIHHYSTKSNKVGKAKNTVTVLGTQYSTNYGEAFKKNFYGVITEKGLELKETGHGPRHLKYQASELQNNLEFINDPAYYTLLRITVDSDHYPIPYDQLRCEHIDVKYNPMFNDEALSDYKPDQSLFSINEDIISEYVGSANSIISKEVLMEGYRLLKDED